MLTLLTDPSTWLALLTLTVMEIVLGIDNIVFISVLVSNLPKEMAANARQIGLLLALVFRILLLLVLTWLIGLTQPVVSGFGFDLSWKDLILIGGGLFLLYKATHEMHKAVEEPELGAPQAPPRGSFIAVIVQIAIIDMVFSIDSIVTAIGMAQHVEVMIAAVVIAVGIMYVASGTVAGFIARHPTTKMLALAFLLPPAALLTLLLSTALFAGYSLPPVRFKARPLLDGLSNVAYALPLALPALLLGRPVPVLALLALCTYSVGKHAFDAAQDSESDRKVGLNTTAVWLGVRGTALYALSWFVLAGALLWPLSRLSALALLLVCGGMACRLWTRPSTREAARLYPLSIVTPWIVGGVSGVQLVYLLVRGLY